MIDLFQAVGGSLSFCDRHGWQSCFIGGIAVQRRGEPRLTRDIDLTLLTVLATSLGALAIEKTLIERAMNFSFAPGVNLRSCSAEDLIVLKLFASRPLDIRDSEGAAIRHGEQLDWE